MSAPDTNLKKQRSRHAGPLIGMGVGLALAAVLLFAYLTYVATPEPDDELPPESLTYEPVTE